MMDTAYDWCAEMAQCTPEDVMDVTKSISLFSGEQDVDFVRDS